MNRHLLLLLCAASIYASFLSWAYLQEKLSSSNYSISDLTPEHFHAPYFINIVQCCCCILVGGSYLLYKTRRDPTLALIPSLPLKTWAILYAISVSQSISSPLGYMSLSHVDYVLFLLAKSCKLIPVMLVHYVAFGTIYPRSKYIVAATVTIGVVIFTIGGYSAKATSSTKSGNITLGMAMLCGSLLLDGFTNSAQDVIFKTTNGKITGSHLMTILNIFTLTNLTLYTTLCTNQFTYVREFVSRNGPAALVDVAKFAACGALGQVSIFITLEKFNSVVLITVTVTRKMLSMVLSVVLFGHVLNWKQWVGLVLVFAGIGLESLPKIFKSATPETKLKAKTV
jgi:UDP-galactose transporter B1